MDEATRRRCIQDVLAFLRDPAPHAVFSLDAAAATASRGYSLGIDLHWEVKDGQPPGYETLVKRGVIPAPKSQYEVHPDARPSPRESQVWEDHVSAACDSVQEAWERRWPLYLRVGVPRTVGLLSEFDRRVMQLYLSTGSFRCAGTILQKDGRTIRDHWWAALDFVVSEIWDESGSPRYC